MEATSRARRAIIGLLAVAGLLVMHGVTAHGLGHLHEHPGPTPAVGTTTHNVHGGATGGHWHGHHHAAPTPDATLATSPTAAPPPGPASDAATDPASTPRLHLHLVAACLAVLVAALVILAATRNLSSPSSSVPPRPWTSVGVPRSPTPHRLRLALCVERC